VVIAVFGGILWSLYIIDPPEALTEVQIAAEQKDAEERAAEDERTGLAFSFMMDMGSIDTTRESIENSKHLSDEERAKLNEDLTQITNLYGDMISTIGAE
jgi:hypothetical protein